jgi:hypothetical protein
MINPNQLIALGCWIMLASLPGCSKESDNADVRFAKTTFFSMVNGAADETAIDWEIFRSPTDDLGAIYKALPNDTEKASFRKQFLGGFAGSTPNIKANPNGITHWRVQSETPSETVVAADMQKGVVLLITISKRDGKQKLSAMKIDK